MKALAYSVIACWCIAIGTFAAIAPTFFLIVLGGTLLIIAATVALALSICYLSGHARK